MADKSNRSIRVGLFIFLSFLLFVAAILILGRKRNMFQPTIRITTVFRDVRGLKVGNNVRFTGIEVGAVVGINILSDTAVSVQLSMDKNVVPYIKKDSKATIGTEGLMGSKIVLILPGSPGSQSIEPGDQILALNPVEIDDIVKEIKTSSEKISQVANNLIEITEKINRGDGIFGKLFTDSELTAQIEQSGRNIASLSANMNQLVYKLNTGQGMMGKMFVDTAFANRIDTASVNIVEISNNLQQLSEKVNQGEGVFGRLFADTSLTDNFYSASKDLETILVNLSEVSEKLNDENNAVHKFIADPEFADSVEVMLNNLNTAIVEVTEASEALQNSGLVRAFSKDQEKQEKKKARKNEKMMKKAANEEERNRKDEEK
jgi:phospholipid/cholesterol/gamma-HCH transport system substrate-binding protein